MNWLYEGSLFVLAVGVIAAIVLVFAWLQTGRRAFLYSACACLLLIVLAAFVERRVVTDREAVEAALRAVAQDVERNDLDAVLRRVHSQSPQIRSRAAAEFPRYEFETVSIKSNLTITFDQPANPAEAVATFNVVVSGRLRDQRIDRWKVPRFVTVTFRREDGQWRAFSYEHHDPREGFAQPRAP